MLSPGGTALEVGGEAMGADAGIGGSILNSLGLTAIGLPAPGNALGPLAALENLDQIIAGALGWDGDGSPLADVFAGL
ncbi:hypothetical protein KIH27_11155 [Mycobacterium sp. M1]|uniref:Uncharacterized protein n=1 Tax=Mycolicibacter acidiphilus TaxID=2835306 RepID=A0ABS5RKL1_9MYCO|nr:hypothetical protein [Mycolicibacter acidiphilus]MBS9534143.1 hypothetical protein [Mycolicibacter acidiphilus]